MPFNHTTMEVSLSKYVYTVFSTCFVENVESKTCYLGPKLKM